jgi:hypothetical protein
VVVVLLASAGPSAALGTVVTIHGVDRMSHAAHSCEPGAPDCAMDGLVQGAGALLFGLLIAGGGYFALGMTARDWLTERRGRRGRASPSSAVG